jgi:serralysin
MCWLCLAGTPQSAGGRAAAGGLAEAADGPASTAARFHVTVTGQAAVDGLFTGYAWASNDPVSFAFTDSASDYEGGYGNAEPTRGFGSVSAAMQATIRKVLLGNDAAGAMAGPGSPGPSVLGFTNLVIVESATDWNADIRIARSSAPSTAWAYYPNAREGGDVWFGSRAAFETPLLGNYAYLVAVHELGHALGLKHGHEQMNGFGAVPTAMDSLEYTVMSYRSRTGASVSTGYTNGAYDYPQGWMMLDIAALQAMYGADYGMRPGDTTYSWNATTGETLIDGIGQGRPGDGAGGASNRVFLTVWDGGGRDTYDLSNYQGGVLADLAPGGFTLLSRAQLATLDTRDGTQARGNVFNALLFEGNTLSLIENAVGGAGADTLLGNQAQNVLRGGAGDDLLRGLAGDDLLVGGLGADTMEGGTGDDRYVVDRVGDRVIELADQGLDTVRVDTASTITLPDHVEILLLGTGGHAGIGNGLANLMFGNATANRLEGLAGADVLEGRAGHDTLLGGSGPDRFVLRRGDGFDRIEDFGSGQDKLVLAGFGFSQGQIESRLAQDAAGLRLDLGGGDGVLFAGLQPGGLQASDFIL